MPSFLPHSQTIDSLSSFASLLQCDCSMTVFPPWHFDRWTAVDDRVRGGASVSHLEPVKVNGQTAARFHGTLGESPPPPPPLTCLFASPFPTFDRGSE